MHAERDLIIDVAAAWNGQREVVENSLAKSMAEGETVRGRKIDPRLPFFGATFQSICQIVWRNPDLH
jgi:hypothetical protein